MSNAAKSEKLTSEAAQRAAQRIRIKIHDFDAGTGVCGSLNKSNKEFLDRTSAEDAKIIIEEFSVAASAEVSELREALRKYGEHTVNCQYWDCSSVCNCGLAAILQKHGDSR